MMPWLYSWYPTLIWPENSHARYVGVAGIWSDDGLKVKIVVAHDSRLKTGRSRV